MKNDQNLTWQDPFFAKMDRVITYTLSGDVIEIRKEGKSTFKTINLNDFKAFDIREEVVDGELIGYTFILLKHTSPFKNAFSMAKYVLATKENMEALKSAVSSKLEFIGK